jgi:hypothetical protein
LKWLANVALKVIEFRVFSDSEPYVMLRWKRKLGASDPGILGQKRQAAWKNVWGRLPATPYFYWR